MSTGFFWSLLDFARLYCLYCSLLGSTGLYLNVLMSVGLYGNHLNSIAVGPYWALLGFIVDISPGLSWTHVHLRLLSYFFVLVFTGSILLSVSLYRSVQVCSGLCCSVLSLCCSSLFCIVLFWFLLVCPAP